MLAVLGAVARAHGCSISSTARAPYVLTLVAYMELRDADFLSDMASEGRRIDDAYMAAMAFNDPARLEDVHVRWKDRAGLLMPVDTRREWAAAQLAALQQMVAAPMEEPAPE